MKKVIVLSVIALFIGVGVQPAFAVESKSSADTTENEEDCDCQTVSDIGLNRLEKVTEIKDLSNRISTLTEMDMENETICGYLFLWFYIELFIIQSFIDFFFRIRKLG